MPIIDNKTIMMKDALAKALENADRIDIGVAFFTLTALNCYQKNS